MNISADDYREEFDNDTIYGQREELLELALALQERLDEHMGLVEFLSAAVRRFPILFAGEIAQLEEWEELDRKSWGERK